MEISTNLGYLDSYNIGSHYLKKKHMYCSLREFSGIQLNA